MIHTYVWQVISTLFPWSSLFPDSLNSILIRRMSLPEQLIEENQNYRFYAQQMIEALETIDKNYPNKRNFIVVGHSLGIDSIISSVSIF